MNLLLVRKIYTDKSTIGNLYIDDTFQCYTLEDVTREEKVYGKTAIPEGRYEVIIDMSSRFKKELPRLLGVPNFSGIRIHAGNKAADTEGCILVGTSKTTDYISNSRVALAALMEKLEAAYIKKEPIYIKVING